MVTNISQKGVKISIHIHYVIVTGGINHNKTKFEHWDFSTIELKTL